MPWFVVTCLFPSGPGQRMMPRDAWCSSQVEAKEVGDMKYERFEDLPVWKAAIELGVQVYRLTQDPFFNQPGDLRGQLRRASLSVSNNTAEGFERGSTAELIAFLYIARGSAGETRSALLFTERFAEAAHMRSQISNCKSLAESCSRQIRVAERAAELGHQGPTLSERPVTPVVPGLPACGGIPATTRRYHAPRPTAGFPGRKR